MDQNTLKPFHHALRSLKAPMPDANAARIAGAVRIGQISSGEEVKDVVGRVSRETGQAVPGLQCRASSIMNRGDPSAAGHAIMRAYGVDPDSPPDAARVWDGTDTSIVGLALTADPRRMDLLRRVAALPADVLDMVTE